MLETSVSVSITSVHLARRAKVNITISNTNAEFGLITNDVNDSSLGFNIMNSNVKFLDDINTSQWYAFSHDSEITLSNCKLKESTISLVNSKGFLTSVVSSDLKVISDASSTLFVSDCNIGILDSQSLIVFSGTENVFDTVQVNTTAEIGASTLSIDTMISSNVSFTGTQEGYLKITTCKTSTLEIHVPVFVGKVSESSITVYSDSEISLGDVHSSVVVQNEANAKMTSWDGIIENNGHLDIKDSECKELVNNNILSVSSPLTITTLSNNGHITMKGSVLFSDNMALFDGSMINCDKQSRISSGSVHGKGNIWSNCSFTATRVKGDDCSFVFENTTITFPVIEGTSISLKSSHATLCNSSESSITLKESDIMACSSGLHISQTTVLLDHCNDIALGKFEAVLSSIIVNNTHLRMDDKGILDKSSLDVINSHITLFHTSLVSSTSQIHTQNTTVLLPERSSMSFNDCATLFQETEFSGLGRLRFSGSSVSFDKMTALDADILVKNGEILDSFLEPQRAFTADNSSLKNSRLSADELHLTGNINCVNSTINTKSLEALCNSKCQITADKDSSVSNAGNGVFKGYWTVSTMTNNGVIRLEKGTVVFNSLFSNGTIFSDESSTCTFHDILFSERSVLSGGEVIFMKDSNIQGKIESLRIGASHIGLTVKGALSLTDVHMSCKKSRLDLQEGVFVQGTFSLDGDADVTCNSGHIFKCNEGSSIGFNGGVGSITGECFDETSACTLTLSKSAVSCDSSNNIQSLEMEDSAFSSQSQNQAKTPTIKTVFTQGKSSVEYIDILQVMVQSGTLECLNVTVLNSITTEKESDLSLVSSELGTSCVTQGSGTLRAASSTIGGSVFCDIITSKTVHLKNNTFVSKIISNQTDIIGMERTTHVTFGTLATSEVSLNNLNISVKKTASLSSFVNCTNTSLAFETNSVAVFSDAKMTCINGECLLKTFGSSQTTGSTKFDGFRTTLIQPLAVTGILFFQSSFGSGNISLLNNSQLVMDSFKTDGYNSIAGPGTLLCIDCQLSGLISNTAVILNNSNSVLTVGSTLTIDESSTFLFESGTLEGNNSLSTLIINGTMNGLFQGSKVKTVVSFLEIDSSGVVTWNNPELLSHQSTITNRNALTLYEINGSSLSFPKVINYGTVNMYHTLSRNVLDNYGSVRSVGINSLLNIKQESGEFCLNGSTSLKKGQFSGGVIQGNGTLSFESLVSFSGTSILSPGGEGGYGAFDLTFLRLFSKALFEIGGYKRGRSSDYILSRGACHIPSTIEVVFRSFVPQTGDEFVLIQCAGDITGKPKATFKGIDHNAATLEIRNNSVVVVVTGCPKPPFNVSNCTECQPGFSLHENNITCSQCQPGSVSSTLNSISCKQCPDESVQPEPGQIACEPCPNGTTTNDHITCYQINETASIIDWSSSSTNPKVVTWVIPVIFFGILLLFLLFTRRHKKKKEIVVTLKQEPDELEEHDEPLLITPPLFPDFTVCPFSFPFILHCFTHFCFCFLIPTQKPTG